MNKTDQDASLTAPNKARTEQAEMRTEQAETRAKQAETRTEQARTRTEQAETRAEQAETTLQLVVDKEVNLIQGSSMQRLKSIPEDRISDLSRSLDLLTDRQREILKLIAEGQNTKQIAEILKISPKTVEYHRLKVMDCLNVHDIPGLVRFALRSGLIAHEG